MGKKKSDEAKTAKDAKEGKKEKLSVSAMLASMDQKPDKAKKPSSSGSTGKPKPKTAPSSYLGDVDLLPSDDEDDAEVDQWNDVQKQPGRPNRGDTKSLDISISDKELKKREKKDMLAAQAAELAKKEALRDDHDAFTVVIGVQEFGVQAMPTFLLIKKGKEVDKVVGARKDDLQKKIEKYRAI